MTSIKLFWCLVSVCVILSCNTDHDTHAHEVETHDTHSSGHHTGVLEISKAIQKDTVYYDEYVCQINAHQHIELKAIEEGYLQKVLVDEGQQVKKGQLLFEIQPTIYLAEIQIAKAEVLQAEAELEKTKIEVQNLKALVDSNIVSENELALAQAEMHQAEAHVANVNAELNLMKAHLEFTKIRAPFNGTIGRFEDIRLGSLLETGEVLTTLTDNSDMWVYFNVPEAVYLNHKQYPAESVELDLKLANNQIFDQKGKVSAIQAEFDNTTGTIAFRATFKNPKRLLRHGQTGKILWPRKLDNMLFIPQKSTFEVLEKRFVYLVDDDGVVSSREIKVAAELDNIYAVSEGLNLNNKFLIEGLRKVKPGDQIEFEYKDPKMVFERLKLHAE